MFDLTVQLTTHHDILAHTHMEYVCMLFPCFVGLVCQDGEEVKQGSELKAVQLDGDLSYAYAVASLLPLMDAVFEQVQAINPVDVQEQVGWM